MPSGDIVGEATLDKFRSGDLNLEIHEAGGSFSTAEETNGRLVAKAGAEMSSTTGETSSTGEGRGESKEKKGNRGGEA
ncbi:unnamed protein product [Microthlaspi erraticum]|uniref:Uncharacterized protein n=1 Tax=Microthlaspi erraticum TaxID=1685480 RepID=A0A6D2IJT5_9BRAS|nr:unnamed protein product [Microthlaspi erraticum]